MLERVVISLSKSVEGSFAEIGLISDDRPTCVRASPCALNGALHEPIEHPVIGGSTTSGPVAPSDPGAAGSDDSGAMPPFFAALGLKSVIDSPILDSAGRLLGRLAVVSPSTIHLTESDASVFEMLAALVGTEIERCRALRTVLRKESDLRAMAEDNRRTEERCQQEQDRSRMIAEYASALAGTFDFEQTLERVAYLPVPRFADSCAVILFEEHGTPIVAESHVNPEIERRLREERAEAPARTVDIREQLMSGESIFVDDLDLKDALDLGLSPHVEARVRLRTIRSLILVPLVSGGSTIGALFFTTSRRHSDRVFSREDLEFAKALGLRAGTAIGGARLYAELEKSHAQKDQFLATLAHELRNPIAAILNAVSVLEIGSQRSHPRALEIAKRQAHQLARLVDDLMDVSRVTRGKIVLRRKPVHAYEVLREVVEAQRVMFDRKSQRLELAIPERGDGWVNADPARLEQIIVNLLDNASKYTEEHGTIRVEAENRGDDLVFRVSDTGQGIDEEMIDGIFDMFQQAPAGGKLASGLGIGLTVVRELVRLHEGVVSVTSEGPGKGSTFEVRLPLFTGRADPRDASGTTERRSERRRILVVDDNVDAAAALSELLAAWGHDLRTVNDGRSAVVEAQRFNPELALVDIAMPGMDGYATARSIRQLPNGENIYLVALTGYGQPADIQKALDARFDRHLTKPARHETLRHLVESLGLHHS